MKNKKFISILLNGEVKEISIQTNLSNALQSWGYNNISFALALNHVFIPRTQHSKHILKADDEVEIVSPMQGG